MFAPTKRQEHRPPNPRLVILERGRIGEPWSIQELCNDYREGDEKMLKLAVKLKLDWNIVDDRYEDLDGVTYVRVIGKV